MRPIWIAEIGRVAARYDSCVGLIATRIDGDDDGIARLDLTVPPNCVAEIELPSGFEWREGADPLQDSADILSCRVDGGSIHAEVGSGEYHFVR